jgi:hypothetical protein
MGGGMSERYSRHAIITIDESDFAIYRRKKREIIPVLFAQKQSKSLRRSQPNCIKFPSLMLGLRSPAVRNFLRFYASAIATC